MIAGRLDIGKVRKPLRHLTVHAMPAGDGLDGWKSVATMKVWRTVLPMRTNIFRRIP
jgi:hypothetical protein